MKYPLLVREKLHTTAVWQTALRVALAVFLSAAQLSQTYAPFSLALIAAAGPRLSGLAYLLGSGIGSLLFFDFQNGLRYAAAAILIFSTSVAFHDSTIYQRPFFMPLMSALMLVLVQSVYLVDRSPDQWVLCAVAATITTAAVRALHTLPKRTCGYLLLGALLLGSSRYLPISTFSPGRAVMAALVFVLTSAAPPMPAAIVGSSFGLALDLVPTPPQLLFCAVYGISAAVAALCRKQPRWIRIFAFFVPCATLPVLFGAEYPGDQLCEALLCSLLCSVVPSSYLRPLSEKKAAASDAGFQECMAKSAAAFRELYDSFFRGTQSAPPENPSVIFDRAAEQVCRDCVLCSNCWHDNYSTLYSAFNDACPVLLRRGQAQAQDFPLHFSSRCVHFPELLGAINMELRAFLLRRQYHQRLLSARQQAQEQYALLGDLLSSAECVEAVPVMAQPLGYHIGSALRPKEGERVCGDQLAVFEVGSTLYLLLSDGMGSGESAHREAAMTVRLLRQFLAAGIDATPALKTLNTALSLRGDSGGGFTTIDLLALHRGNGEAILYKYGAAPSYLKKSGSITRITGQSLPAGLQDFSDSPECTHLTLPGGSFLVMISDGIADSSNDSWLQDLLAGWNGSDCHALVSLILSESCSRKGLADDCAVLALQLPASGMGQQV